MVRNNVNSSSPPRCARNTLDFWYVRFAGTRQCQDSFVFAKDLNRNY